LNSGKLASLIAIAAAILTGAAEPADSAHGWIKATPEEVGMDSAAIAEMIEFSREQRIPVHSVQIIRNGKLALDAYFYPYDGSTRHDVASVTKSVTSILVGLAIRWANRQRQGTRGEVGRRRRREQRPPECRRSFDDAVGMGLWVRTERGATF
jgi:hypothetical protein